MAWPPYTVWYNGGIVSSFRGETIIRKLEVHDRAFHF